MKALNLILAALSVFLLAASTCALPVLDADSTLASTMFLTHISWSSFLANDTLADGSYRVTYDTSGLPSGVIHRPLSKTRRTLNTTPEPQDNAVPYLRPRGNTIRCETSSGRDQIDALNYDIATKELLDDCAYDLSYTSFVISDTIVAFFCQWRNHVHVYKVLSRLGLGRDPAHVRKIWHWKCVGSLQEVGANLDVRSC